MTDGELAGLLRKLYFYSHVHIPNEGEQADVPNHFVKLHGILPESEWLKLKGWLADDAQKSDKHSDPEPGT